MRFPPFCAGSPLVVLWIMLAGLLPLFSLSCSPQRESPPNIVLFYVDDLGWKDVGFNGSTFYETPVIDAFAAEGMVFPNAYSNAPNCAPSRASLLTGLYPTRHKIYTVAPAARGREENRRMVPPPDTRELSKDFGTLAEALGRLGYATGHFGKWHVGGEGNLPTDRGFDVNAGGTSRGAPRGYFSPYRNPALADGPEGEYLTDRLTDEALRFIETNSAQPFFLYLSHFAVHTPIQAKPALEARYADKPASGGQDSPAYAAMIESTDQSFGRILADLESRGIAQNTVVIFYSDNGGFAGATSNEPLRGFKGMLYEGGIRVPLAIRWPGVIAAGQTAQTPVIGTDLFTTLTKIAGDRAENSTDGLDLSALFRGEDLVERPLFWHFPAYLEAGPGVEGFWRTTPAGAVRLGDYKLIEFFEDGRLELYNLRDDPSESRDLAPVEPSVTSRLHALLVDWRAQTGADMPVPK